MRGPGLALLVLLSAALAGADEWVLGGGGGISWNAVVQSSAQVDVKSVPGAIQSRGFRPDENIIPTLKWSYGKPADLISERDAALWDNTAFQDPTTLKIVDGQDTTSTVNLFKVAGVDQTGRVFVFDLGSRVPAQRLVFYPRPEGATASGRPYSEDFIRKFEVQFSDGLSYAAGQPVFQLLREVPVNPNSVIALDFPPQFIRFLRLRVGSRSPFEIAEFQVFGDGFVPRAFYESRVMDLGNQSNYGRIRWAQQERRLQEGALVPSDGAATAVTVRMKTGLDNTPLVYYHLVVNPETHAVSEELASEAEYLALDDAERGRIEEDAELWSPWSPPLVSGQQIPLPSPRPFFQLQILLESASVQHTVSLDSLVIEHEVPPASSVEGEISLADEPDPVRGVVRVEGGAKVLFAYDVRAQVERGQTGFDALRIDTPSRPVFHQLSMGEPLVQVEPDSVAILDTGLEVFFARNKLDFSHQVPLRVLFEGAVVIFNTIFSGRVWDTQTGGAGQPVLEGDANFAVSTNTLQVALSKESIGALLRQVKLNGGQDAVFTPNGDGVNDRLLLDYTITQLTEPRRVEVALYDLGGRQVRSLVDQERVGGLYREVWDGRDEGGAPVPPGVYVMLIRVHSGIGSFEQLRSVGVAY
ncbi:MAG: gliding motility-associated C-terminal domain-containing protein [Candidatus Latescibacteria bacterium]|nr:gliding motility-associated C-terminal domain-containing protein [Candidatus Latescibacterota bacterium]